MLQDLSLVQTLNLVSFQIQNLEVRNEVKILKQRESEWTEVNKNP